MTYLDILLRKLHEGNCYIKWCKKIQQKAKLAKFYVITFPAANMKALKALQALKNPKMAEEIIF